MIFLRTISVIATVVISTFPLKNGNCNKQYRTVVGHIEPKYQSVIKNVKEIEKIKPRSNEKRTIAKLKKTDLDYVA